MPIDEMRIPGDENMFPRLLEHMIIIPWANFQPQHDTRTY